ncbi:MAG: TDT family transporter [Rhodococcus sp. (in: high G+C Gram-positive bacteria)]
MTAVSLATPDATPTATPAATPGTFVAAPDAKRPRSIVEHLTPNWYASIMGTGIVANASATLPVHIAGLHVLATAVWLLASVALVALSVAFVIHWVRHTDTAREYARHPVMALFYGAVPMAVLTVGAGTLLLGEDLIGESLAVWISASLWTVGTVMGAVTCCWIPYRMMKASKASQLQPLPAWLMPVVPPMVSASTGAMLLPYVPEGVLREGFLLACYGLFVITLVLGSAAMTMIYARLFRGYGPPLQSVPTVWIALGLVGQSITAANLLGADASIVFTGDQATIARGLHAFGVGYGLVVAVVGAVVFAVAVAATTRAARNGLTFSLTWWSFTFPIGTCVTGATALWTSLGATPAGGAAHVMAIALYGLLLTAWVVVATRTVLGSLNGRLFAAV